VSAVVCAVAGAAACNAILGINDVPIPVVEGPEAGAPSDDGGDSSATTSTGPDAASDSGVQGAEASSVCTPADLQGDTHNCGTCGHDCLGGACQVGSCLPVALVGGDSGVAPFRLAQDDSFLYWTDTYATVYRTSKTTGETAPLYDQAAVPVGIAVDDASVYWADSKGIWSTPKTSFSENATLVANVISGGHDLAIDDVGIYWSEEGPAIYAAHKYGNGETGSALWEGDADTSQVASDGLRVYFTADDGLLHAVALGDGGAVVTGTANAAGSNGLALYSGSVYWSVSASSPSGGSVWGASTAALSATDVASDQPYPYGVASDGVTLFWSNVPYNGGDGAKILSCGLGSCTPTVLATGMSGPFAVVVDDVAVYWTDNQSPNGRLWRLAK